MANASKRVSTHALELDSKSAASYNIYMIFKIDELP